MYIALYFFLIYFVDSLLRPLWIRRSVTIIIYRDAHYATMKMDEFLFIIMRLSMRGWACFSFFFANFGTSGPLSRSSTGERCFLCSMLLGITSSYEYCVTTLACACMRPRYGLDVGIWQQSRISLIASKRCQAWKYKCSEAAALGALE